MNKRMNEQELSERLATLPREISPGRDPWPEIAARITPSGRSQPYARAWWIRAVAATAVLAVAAGLLFSAQWNKAPGPGQDSHPQTVENGGNHAGLPGLLAGSEAEYLAAFREFIPLGHSRTVLPTQIVEKIEMSWTELTNTETALAAAMDKHPNDPFLNDRMRELRARQLGFLKQLAMLDSSNRRMTT